AVSSAAGRVGEGAALAAVEAWLARLRDPATPEGERGPLARAVSSAAGRVAEGAALAAVEAVLARLRDPATPKRERGPLADAVSSAAGRVKEEMKLAFCTKMIAEGREDLAWRAVERSAWITLIADADGKALKPVDRRDLELLL